MYYSNTDLARFIDTQNKLYHTAISEIEKGKKVKQWMWFIFPQLRGLGNSFLSEYYGISDIDEANKFMKHPVLSKNLIKISQLLLVYKRKSAEGILGDLNARKLLSCMTLFSQTENAHPVFQEILDTFFFGYNDQNTLYLIKPKLELVS